MNCEICESGEIYDLVRNKKTKKLYCSVCVKDLFDESFSNWIGKYFEEVE